MRSVKRTSSDHKSRETVEAILACLNVQTKTQHKNLCRRVVRKNVFRVDKMTDKTKPGSEIVG